MQFAGRFTEEMMVIGRVGVEIRAPRLDDGLAQQPGFGRWLAEDRPVERGPAKGYPQAVFAAKPRPGRFIGKDKVLAVTKDPEFVIVNALGRNSIRVWSQAATAARVVYRGASMSRQQAWSTRKVRHSPRLEHQYRL